MDDVAQAQLRVPFGNVLTVPNEPLVIPPVGALGAHIEGVVVEATQHGVPTDRLVWCLAVPAREAVVARVALPAWRSRTGWTAIIDDLMAVISWGQWADHPMGRSTNKDPGLGDKRRSQGGSGCLMCAHA